MKKKSDQRIIYSLFNSGVQMRALRRPLPAWLLCHRSRQWWPNWCRASVTVMNNTKSLSSLDFVLLVTICSCTLSSWSILSHHHDQFHLNCTFPQFCKEDTAEDGAAGPLLCVEVTKIKTKQNTCFKLSDMIMRINEEVSDVKANFTFNSVFLGNLFAYCCSRQTFCYYGLLAFNLFFCKSS